MNFLNYEVSTSPNSLIEVTLSNAANVLVMDEANFQSFRSGRSYRYHGGHYNQSPVIIKVPSGRWHVVVHVGGAGSVSAAVRVLG
jgi:Domain of unknown function (DUF1883)